MNTKKILLGSLFAGGVLAVIRLAVCQGCRLKTNSQTRFLCCH